MGLAKNPPYYGAIAKLVKPSVVTPSTCDSIMLFILNRIILLYDCHSHYSRSYYEITIRL